jgi:hypothetical protein
MAVAKTLAYYDTVTITAVKSFIVPAPDDAFAFFLFLANFSNLN